MHKMATDITGQWSSGPNRRQPNCHEHAGKCFKPDESLLFALLPGVKAGAGRRYLWKGASLQRWKAVGATAVAMRY
jgi:hypothetical protein